MVLPMLLEQSAIRDEYGNTLFAAHVLMQNQDDIIHAPSRFQL